MLAGLIRPGCGLSTRFTVKGHLIFPVAGLGFFLLVAASGAAWVEVVGGLVQGFHSVFGGCLGEPD